MSWYNRREHWTQQNEDAREVGDIDYARVIHSASFRRLQGKTQILNLGDSDFYRTRLTHSLEVAQIAASLIKQLKKDFATHLIIQNLPSRSMIQAIGCTHDLGHPPFGHGGEVALNYCMRNHGGFEGNGQTLRILSRLENFSRENGANLSRRTLLGVLKYPVPFSIVNNQTPQLETNLTTINLINPKSSKPPKCYFDSEIDVVNWILKELPTTDKDEFTKIIQETDKHHKSKYKSFDCSVMDAADDISYGVHDLEDAIALRLLSRENFETAVPSETCSSFLNAQKEKYPDEYNNNVYSVFLDQLFGSSAERKRCINHLIHYFVTAMNITEIDCFQEPLLRYRVEIKEPQQQFLKALHDVVYNYIITHPVVQHLEFKGQHMVVSVFEALASDPKRLLPHDAYKLYDREKDWRCICDYVAGMTDSHLLKTYERLFSPRMGSVFDKL